MLRSIDSPIIGLALGTVLAFTLVYVIEGLGHRVFYPLPESMDQHALTLMDPAADEAAQAAAMQAFADHIASAPLGELLFPVLAWFVAAFAGVWLARYLSRSNPRRAALVGALVTLATILNLSAIPHPGWMWPVGIAAPLLGTLLGMRVGGSAKGAAEA